ncbi:MAG: hypothetical protein AB2L18_09410 [Anaerolineaceae bacterium]
MNDTAKIILGSFFIKVNVKMRKKDIGIINKCLFEQELFYKSVKNDILILSEISFYASFRTLF